MIKKKNAPEIQGVFFFSNFDEEGLLPQHVQPGLYGKISFCFKERPPAQHAHLVTLLLASFSAFGAKTPRLKI